MSNSQLYMDFFDGNMDYLEEQKFCEMLSSDEILRSGLKGYVSLTGAINSNLKSFAPSKLETQEIYTKLGLSLPSGFEPVAAATVTKSAFFGGQLFKHLLTGVSFAVLGIVGTILYFNFGKSNDVNSGNSQLNYQKENIQAERTISSNGQSEIPKAVVTKSKPIIKYIYIKEKVTEPTESTFNNVQMKPDNKINVTQPENSLSINQPPVEPKINLDEPLKINPINTIEQPLINISEKNIGLSLEVKSSANWNLPKETIYPSEIAKFNNMNLSLLYNISENFKIGADLRQETFFVEYFGNDEINRLTKYQQQPNLLSIGALLRYAPEIDLGGFKPYAQGIISTNNFGIIERVCLGFEYKLYPNFGIITQVEYSNMDYKHQTKWFKANKLGVNYGIIYLFK